MNFSIRMLLAAVLSGMIVPAFAARPLDRAVLHGETDKARATDYAVGEEIVFTLTLQGAGEFKAGDYFINWERTGDDGVVDRGRVPLSATEPLIIKTRLGCPGFVRCHAEVVDAKGVRYRKEYQGETVTPEGRKALNRFERSDRRVFFDGGAGAEIEKLASVPEPADFDEFWAKRKARLAEVPMTATVREQKSSDPAVKVYTFSVLCAGPRPVTGTYSVPVDSSRKYPGHIWFHGYGAHYVQAIPTGGPRDKVFMHINAHGYELGREDMYYTEFYKSIMSNGRTFGLDSKWQNLSADTAYFGGMCYRIMRALQFLKSLPEWDGRTLVASGGSMGGLQTIWAAALDSDVTSALPVIPWCCDMGGRQTLKRNYGGWGVDETEAMRYFDPVNMARRIGRNCRVEIVRAGLGDYCCPPCGVAIFYNNIPGPKKINWVQGSNHSYVPIEPHQKYSLSENW